MRRSRGYAFEKRVVNMINADNNSSNNNNENRWHAVRLGGTTTTMPDIIATCGKNAYAIECKSGYSQMLYVPAEQIARCHRLLHGLLGYYERRHIILAFYFANITCGPPSKRGRQNRRATYFFEVPDGAAYDVRCSDAGEITARAAGGNYSNGSCSGGSGGGNYQTNPKTDNNVPTLPFRIRFPYSDSVN